MRRISLTALVCLGLAAPAFAIADGPDAWRVVNVAADDVLNVRVGPGTEYFVIDTLPHDARGVQVSTCVPTILPDQYYALSVAQEQDFIGYTPWCIVIWDGQQRGWVNRRYLAEDMD